MIRVKICGLTNLADARFAAAAGADFLGFVQYAASPRRISADEAREIIEWVQGPQTVGVYLNDPLDEVNRSADRARFDLVQLHGDESPDFCRRVERPVIKTFGVAPGAGTRDLAGAIESYRGAAAYVLLDTRLGAQRGGTGVPFDWRAAPADHPSLFLAGGLTPDNVAEAVRTTRPFAVDVASGVEEAPGRKDYARLAAFFESLTAFRGTDAPLDPA